MTEGMHALPHVIHVDGNDYAYPQWTNSVGDCMACGQIWLATHPLACEPLICPFCQSADTVRGEIDV